MPAVRVLHWTTWSVATVTAVLAAVLLLVPRHTETSDAAERVKLPEASKPESAPFASAVPQSRGFGLALEVSASGRIRGEFEHQDALLLGVNELLEYHPQTLCDIVAAVGDRMEIVGLISKRTQERRTLDLLFEHGVASDHLHFFLWPAVSMWVQDFGPICVVDDDVRVVDFNYHFDDRELENQLPLAFAATYGMKITPSRLTMEGGNLLSNGRGLAISSTVLIDQNKPRGYDLQAVAAILQNDFRFQQWTHLSPLPGEPTGHVDMYVTLTSPTSAVVSACGPADDRQIADVLDESAKTLAAVSVDGTPVRVVRIPMPPRRDDKWRTYTNVIYANGTLLVPQFPDYCPGLDREALDVYRKLLPDWKIVGIDASTIVEKRGSLHCLSRNLPHMKSLRTAE